MSLQGTSAASATSGGSTGISLAELDSIYNNVMGSNEYAPPPAPVLTPSQMINNLNQMINQDKLSSTETTSLDTDLATVAAVFAPPAPVASTAPGGMSGVPVQVTVGPAQPAGGSSQASA